MKFQSHEKYAKMTRALARLERTYTETGNAISTADARDATENFFNHAYHLKDYLQKDFPGMAQRVEKYITGSRVLSLVADLHNSFKHGGDIANRRRKHEKESGSPPVGDLVRINTHTKVDLDTTTAKCSQRMEITFQNATFDALQLATETVREWDSFLAAEGITLA